VNLRHTPHWTKILLVAGLMPSCQESNFAGKPPQNQPPAPAATAATAAACQETTQINSKLLTETFANGQLGNSFRYLLTLTGCDGKPQPISVGSLLFDLDVQRPEETIQKGLNFTLTTGDASFSGTLASERGKDLFGNEGPDLYYYRNNKGLELPANSREATLEILLNGEQISPRLGPINKNSFIFETFLKFGPAAPVSHKLKAE
jgi:hypothetical protein